MIQSMTGFGAARGSFPAGALSVELSSVNGRGLSLKLRMPEALSGLQPFVEERIRARIQRGTVTASVALKAKAGGRRARLDPAALAAYAKEFAAARRRIPELPPVDWATLASLPGVMLPPEGDDAAPERALEALLGKALDAFVKDRRREGRALAGHCLGILADAGKALEAAAARRAQAREALEGRLKTRLEEALARAGLPGLDEALRRELVLHAERGDVAEEVARLKVHLAEAKRLLAGEGPVGRRLDFLAQEMLREGNTLGSKSQDAALTHAVIALKTALDQFKEQVQNLE